MVDPASVQVALVEASGSALSAVESLLRATHSDSRLKPFAAAALLFAAAHAFDVAMRPRQPTQTPTGTP